MRTFGVAVATVFCAIQLTAALPRPDFGLSIDVFSADKTSDVATTASADLDTLWSTTAITLNADYDTLEEILTEITAIGTDALAKIKALFDAIVTLADATTDPTGAFDAATAAIDALDTYITSTTEGLSVNYGSLDTALATNKIVLQLEDAFGELADGLGSLRSTLSALKTQVAAAVTKAGSGTVTKAILRQKLSVSDTSDLTITLLELASTLKLIFYVLEESKESLETADQYLISATGVAGGALAYVDAQLHALADEVQLYVGAADSIATQIRQTSIPNLDFSSLDLSVVADIQIETGHIATTYGANLDTAVTSIKGTFTQYKADVLLVSTGYDAFYGNEGADHVYDVVTVLINQGPYAEYCYEKYGDAALALFDINARVAGECVDREITRLLTLQDVLLSIAEQIAFSVEDLLATVTACLDNTTECMASSIDNYLSDMHDAVDTVHLAVLAELVEDETDAGLARLQACFAAAKYDMLSRMAAMKTDIFACETAGPN
ncbi:AGAP007275-PA-like protein [Anopheles sinensis]|uniref:AGAP007275-PA-like protein n=1 Tax=Anopheles sinensis TaxID=74873 RepID=A0A084W872_ANOSI|nr:AGAP007275-PA-like protein [Anopheles sinensis]